MADANRILSLQNLVEPPLFDWLDHRAAGVLLHPTSLPGTQGIGTLEPTAILPWLEFLSAAGLRYWQVCPLGPTGYGDSPYQCFSAFAGNPYLIDLRALQRHGLLAESDVDSLRALPTDHVDFGWLYVTKWPVLFKAYAQFKKNPALLLPYGDFSEFKVAHAHWLESFSLFLAIKDHFKGQPWWEWPAEFRFFDCVDRSRLPAAVVERADAHSFFQYVFFGQWDAVRASARQLGIEIVGDTPIFVARDSADAWSHPKLFQLDQETGHPLRVAGVPPDYFSATGQLWGNPLYDWGAHEADGFSWWIDRLRANFAVCDVLRIDHFRAFDSYWSIPADAKTAKTGSWQPGPGRRFFAAVKAAMPDAKLIAEDLGDLVPSVHELRDATGLPGMAILQFAFGGEADNPYLPHNLKTNCIVYPGTHDNDTTVGWYRTASVPQQDHTRRYFRISGNEIGWDFLRAAYASVANLAIVPLPDLLSLDSTGRLNTPGRPTGNWQWRFRVDQLAQLRRESAGYLKDLSLLYGRLQSEKKRPINEA